GYEGYDYYSPQSSAAAASGASYGYGGAAASAWEAPKASELGLASDVGAAVAPYGADPVPAENSDSIIAKINQRLDMLSKEGSAGAGDGMEEQEGSFRFESFDSYDSRPSLGERDLFRPGYDYGEPGSERGDSFGSRDPSRSRGSGAFGMLR
ncbi:AKAP8 protein, partial [Menura novaehollandiae]|nr:AKAP8 protein [Menura novaehollandiae]